MCYRLLYFRLLCVLIAVTASAGGCDRRSENRTVVRVDAAASVGYVIEGLAGPIQRELGVTVAVNSGASGALAKQIEMGDAASLFVSADPRWLDRLEERGLIDTASRTTVAGNQLVVIGHVKGAERITRLEDLAEKAYQPIAVGDPSYVPAGRYALEALSAHGLTRASGIRLAEAPNVRAALAFVQSGQCPVGVVYASDAKSVDDVTILAEIDPADHKPIVYQAAIVKGGPEPDAARRVLDWLKSDKGRAAFEAAGLSTPK